MIEKQYNYVSIGCEYLPTGGGGGAATGGGGGMIEGIGGAD